MTISIEVSADITGIIDRDGGVKTIAYFGDCSSIGAAKENDELRQFILRSCVEAAAPRNIYTVERKDKVLIVVKRSNSQIKIHDKVSKGKNCTSIRIALGIKEWRLLKTVPLIELLFNNNSLLTLANKFIVSGEPVDLSDLIEIANENNMYKPITNVKFKVFIGHKVYFCEDYNARYAFCWALDKLGRDGGDYFTLATGDVTANPWKVQCFGNSKPTDEVVEISSSNASVSDYLSKHDDKTISDMLCATASAYRSIVTTPAWSQRIIGSRDNELKETSAQIEKNIKVLVNAQTRRLNGQR